MSIEKSAHGIKNNVISDNNIIKTIMRKTAKEHVPNGLDDDKLNNESKDVKKDKWIKPKNCMPMNHF